MKRVAVPSLLLPMSVLMAAMAPQAARAEDPCTQIIVYAVKQFCSLLPNGQSLCQPVALTGLDPACQFPKPEQFKPVPLAAPAMQFAPMVPMTAPYVPAPYVPSPMAAQPVSPFASQSVQATAVPPATPVTPQVPVQRQADTPPVAVTQPAPSTAGVSRKEDGAAPPPPSTVAQAPAAAPSLGPATQSPPPGAIPPVSKAAPAIPAAQTTPATLALPDAPMLPVVVAEAKALFDFDSAELTPLGKETLDRWLATAPVGMPVVISGHADRLGPEPYNLGLSLRRAMAARDYLVAKGKDARDIRIVAKGETEPVKHCKGGSTDATKACLAPNRRVLIAPE